MWWWGHFHNRRSEGWRKSQSCPGSCFIIFKQNLPIILSHFNFNCFMCSGTWSHINTSFKKTIESFISENDFLSQIINTVYKTENQYKNEFHLKNHAINILLNVHVLIVKIRYTKMCLFAEWFLQMCTER